MNCFMSTYFLMKKIGFSLLLTFGVAACVFAQKTWTGSVSTDWNTAGNWSPSGVPSAGQYVSIDACTSCPVLSSDVTIGDLYLNWNAKISLNAKTLTSGLLTATGVEITAGGGTIDAVRTGTYMSNTVIGNFTLKINRNGTDNYLGAQYGGNTYKGAFTLECHTGTGTTYGISNQVSDTFEGNTLLRNIGSGWLMISSGSNCNSVFQQQVQFVNAHSWEGKIQIGAYGGKIQCNGLTKFIDNTASPYSYMYISEGIFNDEVEITTNSSNIQLGLQGATVFKKKVTLFNYAGAHIALGSAGGSATFEKTSDLVIDPSAPMNSGRLYLQFCHFEGDNTTPSVNITLGAGSNPSNPTSMLRLGYYGSFHRPVNFSADYIQYNLMSFHKDVTMTRTGPTGWTTGGFIGYGVCPGNCLFEGDVTFNNAFGDDWILQGYGPDVFKKKVTLKQGSHSFGVLNVAYSGNTTFEGDIDVSLATGAYNGISWGGNGGTATLVASKKLTLSGLANGWLYLGNFRQLGSGNPHVFNVPGAGLTLKNCEFQSPLTVTSNRLILEYSSFMDAGFTKKGNGNDYSIGGNTFKKKVNIKNQSSTGDFGFYSQNSTVVNP